jgi:hypothetical protein
VDDVLVTALALLDERDERWTASCLKCENGFREARSRPTPGSSLPLPKYSRSYGTATPPLPSRIPDRP